MKKLIAGLAILSLLALNPGQSKADDWGWFAAGAAAGLITGAVVADAAHHSHYYGCGHYGYHGYHHTHYYGCGHYGYSYHHHYSGCGHYDHDYYEVY